MQYKPNCRRNVLSVAHRRAHWLYDLTIKCMRSASVAAALKAAVAVAMRLPVIFATFVSQTNARIMQNAMRGAGRKQAAAANNMGVMAPANIAPSRPLRYSMSQAINRGSLTVQAVMTPQRTSQVLFRAAQQPVFAFARIALQLLPMDKCMVMRLHALRAAPPGSLPRA